MDLRVRIWCVLAVLALAGAGVAYAQRPATTPARAPQPAAPVHHVSPTLAV